MRTFCLLIMVFVLLNSCQISKEDIKQLNGYWEIEKVVLENGETKVFSINQTVDYFSVNDSLMGFRKKLNPKFDGTFEHSNDAESIQVYHDNGKWVIKYTTSYAKWKETIKELTEDKVALLNQENRLYIYKRFVLVFTEPKHIEIILYEVRT